MERHPGTSISEELCPSQAWRKERGGQGRRGTTSVKGGRHPEDTWQVDKDSPYPTSFRSLIPGSASRGPGPAEADGNGGTREVSARVGWGGVEDTSGGAPVQSSARAGRGRPPLGSIRPLPPILSTRPVPPWTRLWEKTEATAASLRETGKEAMTSLPLRLRGEQPDRVSGAWPSEGGDFCVCG